jgi:DNA polymerase-3 subunit delta
MIGTVERALAEIQRGRRHPVYLLHGDEYLAKAGAKAIVDALVPPDRQALSVEVVAEDREVVSVPMRLATVPLFGGAKVVVVHDSRAFVSGQSAERMAKRSLDAWQGGEDERAVRLFVQLVAMAGETEAWIERAARGEVPPREWERVLALPHDPDAEPWLEAMGQAAVAAGVTPAQSGGADAARIYEEAIQRVPPSAALVLTAEVVDERRSLFKKIDAAGFIVDCGARPKRAWDTQVSPEAARAKIREVMAAAGKRIEADAVAGIIERTGASMRGLASELDKLVLYVGARPAVTAADVAAVLSHSREANVFELTNAIDEQDAARALLALRSLLTQREPAPRILGMVAAEVRGMILARSVVDERLEGRFDPRVPFEVFRGRILLGLSKEPGGEDSATAKLLRLNAFRAYNLLKGAARFPMSRLLAALAAVRDADLSLKSSGQPEALVLEQLLLRLCAVEPASEIPGPPRRQARQDSRG